MVGGTSLGEYLRARRALVRPGDVGLPDGDRRRVPGLRREEVALLAGVSAEYYLRLEQGRGHHPSEQVLDGLARALRLDAEATEYLHALARPRPLPPSGAPTAGIRDLIDGWTTTPAYVQGRSLTVLAANPLAVALSPYFTPGSDTLRAAFLEPEMRVFYRDWEAMTAKVVPYLRAVLGPGADDPRIAELNRRSDRFRALWARHDVRRRTSGLSLLHHPRAGALDLRYEKLVVPGDGQVLITYHADPDSESADRLRYLADLVTDGSA